MQIYSGFVQDIHDPKEEGRVRIRINELHGDIPVNKLFWSLVLSPTTSSSSGGKGSDHELLEGDMVAGYFLDQDKQNFVVFGTFKGVPRGRSNDPNGKFPEIINEPDVNRLSRNSNIHLTSIGEIRDNRISFDNINKIKYTEEVSKYNAKYPYNKTYESRAGHIVEFDSTPNHTRYHERHPSKNYLETDHDGNTARKEYGDWKHYILGDQVLYTRGNKVETIDGDYNLRIKGDWTIEIDGNLTIWVKKDKDERIEGKLRQFVRQTKETIVKLQQWVWAKHLHLNDWYQERPKPKSGR